MTGKDMIAGLSFIEERFIDELEEESPKKRLTSGKWRNVGKSIAAAASLLLITGVTIMLQDAVSRQGTTTEGLLHGDRENATSAVSVQGTAPETFIAAGGVDGLMGAENIAEEAVIECEPMDTSNMEQIVAGNNELGNSVMGELIRLEMEDEQGADHVFISPYSIATALSVLANCSEEGEHIEELKAFLGYEGLSDEVLMEAQSILMEDLMPAQKDWTNGYSREELDEFGVPAVEFANAVYLDDDQLPTPAFEILDEILKVYQAEVDVKQLESEETKDEINAWVEEKTHGLIKKLLDEPLDPIQAVFLMNSVYFKGFWSDAFVEAMTNKQMFYGMNRDTEVEMMHQQVFHLYAETDDYQVITLPYHYGYQMNIYLPKDAAECQNWSDEGYISSLLNEEYTFESKEVILSMPKFELEYDTELDDILETLGVEKIFSMNYYDRLCESAVEVSTILHKTALKVDEKGTEAAAVTAIIMECAMEIAEDEPVVMTVDRPFYFTITSSKSGLNLFEGCVFDIDAEEE